jgi:hypothetical protein
MQAVVSFDGTSGQTAAAAALGSASGANPAHRNFLVRRRDVFARWILSFAGEVRVVAPPDLAAQVARLAAESRALYDADAPVSPPPAERSPGDPRRRQAWNANTAAEKLRRLLVVLPEIADGEDHSIAEVAARVGCDAETIVSDLHSLAARVDEPGGFVDKFNIGITAQTVSARCAPTGHRMSGHCSSGRRGDSPTS